MFLGFASSKEPMKVTPTAPGPDGEDDLLEEEDESVGEEISKTLVSLMPWGISILFHVALIVVAFFLVWQTIVNQDEEQPVVPSAKLDKDPGAPMEMTDAKTESSDAPTTTPTDPTVPNPTPSVTDTPRPIIQMGRTAQGGQTGGLQGNTTGQGDFGAKMFGKGGNARDIAFVIDASGSMVDVLPFVVNELNRAVNDLSPEQNITIIFFSGEGVFDVLGKGATRLRACDPEFKSRAKEWIRLENFQYDTGGRGGKFAEEAIVRALKYKPQLVFLMSDNLTGGGQGATHHEIFQDDIMEAIRKNNKGTPAAQFKTFQFLYEDPLVEAGLTGTLKLIATEFDSEDNYRFLSAKDLKLQR